MYDILLTCPPMIGMSSDFAEEYAKAGFKVHIPDFTQVMTEAELIRILPDFDGWIIGDDPATRAVLEAGASDRLRACVRWGVGTDNVDFDACKSLGLKITNTPGVFGREVADLAMSYVTALARQTFEIDNRVHAGDWFKPRGQSLWAQKAVVIGYGDIGKNLVKRLLAHDITVSVVDPFCDSTKIPPNVTLVDWENAVEDKDYLIFTAPLTAETLHLFNVGTISRCKPGVRVINVGRGPVVEETAIVQGLDAKVIHSAALDVFEGEPLSKNSPLLKFGYRCLCGSHNGSNTHEAVNAVSRKTIKILKEFLM